MDPITLALSGVATAFMQAFVEVAVLEGLDDKVLRKEIQAAQESALDATINSANDTETARIIIRALDESVKAETRQAFVDELKKVLLLSDQPNVDRLVIICDRHLIYRRGINAELPQVEQQSIRELLSSLVRNLRVHLLDQPTYKKLYTNSEILRIARQQLSVGEQQLDVQKQQLDVEKQQLETLRQIRDTRNLTNVSSRLDFYAHINHPPPNYVARKGILDEIVELIISPNTDPIVFHGMGGLGKSVIARSICDDAKVREFFPDGILMVKLGKKPNVIQILTDLVEHLGGVFIPNTTSTSILKNKLAELVSQRKLLLILDNAWSYTDIEIFNVLNKDSKTFITTRQGIIAEKLGVSPLPCPSMTLIEGIELLTKWSGQRQTDSENTKQTILEKLGFHPLAIKLAGAQLARHPSQSSEEWLSNFNVRMLELEPIESVSDSLKLTIELSLELLSDTKRLLYRNLSVFTEDKNIPSKVVVGLWQRVDNVQETEVHDVLFDLASMALLDTSEESGALTIRLHPLLHNFLRDELGDKELEAAHLQIVEHYRGLRQDNSWSTVVPDGYYYEHFAYHLVGASMSTELYSLLVDSPDWWEAKLAQSGHLSSYVDDIKIAISTFSEPSSEEDLLFLIQLYVARETVHRSNNRYLDDELQAMVWFGNHETALRLAWLRPNPYSQFKSVLAVQKSLKELEISMVEYSQLVTLAEEIQVIEHQIDSYLGIIEFYNSEVESEVIDNLFATALKAVKSEPSSYQQTQSLIRILTSQIKSGRIAAAKTNVASIFSDQNTLSQIASSLLAELLEIALLLEFPDPIKHILLNKIFENLSNQHDESLAHISAKLVKANCIQEALNVTNNIQSNYWRIVAFAKMALSSHEQKHEELADSFFNLAFQFLPEENQQEPFYDEAAAYMLVHILAQAGRISQASNLAYSLRYVHWRGLAFSSLIYQLACDGLIAEARQHYLMRGNCKIEKRSVVRLGLTAIRAGYTELAATLLEKKPPEPIFDKSDHNLANKINRIVNFLIDDGKLDDAVTMAIQIPNPMRRMQTLGRIGWAYLLIGDEKNAREISEQAEELEITNDSYSHVQGLTLLMLLRHGLGDIAHSNDLYKKALNLALGLSTQYGRCSAFESISEFTYYTKDSENDLWSVLSQTLFNETDCMDNILLALSNVVNIKDDPELVNRILTHESTEAYMESRILEHLIDQAIKSEDNSLLKKALENLEQYSNIEDTSHYNYIESLARVQMRLGNFEKALAVSEKIAYTESRASIQVQIAALMLLNGVEAEARQVFVEAEKIASTVQTFTQWRYGLVKWSASLLQLGYLLEAIENYPPDQVFDYTEIVDDWESELNSRDLNLRRDLFLKIIRIYSWTDVEWATVIEYLQRTSYAQFYK